MNPRIATLTPAQLALGAALHYVGRHPPFSAFRAQDLIQTVAGEIERGHYRFALDGARVVGYVGWALYDNDLADRCAAGGHPPPPPSAAQGRDVVWILTAASSSPAAFLALVKAVRALHPRLRLMGVRHKPDRRVLFDRRPREEAALLQAA
jgi:hypothetical protein